MKKANKNRADYGKLAGAVGFFSNLFLAFGKIAAGSIFSSVSVLADGVNNLSDAASSGITLIGFHFSKKPADKKHPYGHARYEYLAALVISAMILAAGFEVAKSAAEQILHPVKIFKCLRHTNNQTSQPDWVDRHGRGGHDEGFFRRYGKGNPDGVSAAEHKGNAGL